LSDPPSGHRAAWLAALLFYALAASGDLAYHLIEYLHTGNEAIEVKK